MPDPEHNEAPTNELLERFYGGWARCLKHPDSQIAISGSLIAIWEPVRHPRHGVEIYRHVFDIAGNGQRISERKVKGVGQ